MTHYYNTHFPFFSHNSTSRPCYLSYQMVKKVTITNTITVNNDTFIVDYAKQDGPRGETFLEQIFPLDDDTIPELEIEIQNCRDILFYERTPGFDISPCPWLTWAPVQLINGNTIKLLKINEGTNLKDPNLPTNFNGKFRKSYKLTNHKRKGKRNLSSPDQNKKTCIETCTE